MGNRSTVPTNRSHLALVDARRPRPGQLMALRIRQQLAQVDREIRDAWVCATHGLPGRADRATEDFRCNKRSPWNGQLEGGVRSIERAGTLRPGETVDEAIRRVERTTERLCRGYLAYPVVFSDAEDEVIGRLEQMRRPTPTPSAPALKAAA